MKGERTMKHDFRYISNKNPEVKEAYDKYWQLLLELQDVLRDTFTFQFTPVGSYKRNMITYDAKSNKGYDFDFNIEPNDDELSAKQTKLAIQNGLNKLVLKYGLDYPEDSTRVITIKMKDRKNSRVLHSCDLAIVNNYIDDDGNECQEYIRFNKKSKTYTWEEQPHGYYMLPEKIQWLKDEDLWDEVRTRYIELKNKNEDENVHSRTLFGITVHQLCQKYGFFDDANT